MTDTATSNQYVTVRTLNKDESYGTFHINTINFGGSVATFGQHGYTHKRSARRAAIALAKKLDVSYRQDLEYTETPHAFVATVTV